MLIPLFLLFFRYFVESKSLQNEIKRMVHDLSYESQQRSNLLRQIELQAKQLNCIEKVIQYTFCIQIFQFLNKIKCFKLRYLSPLYGKNIKD